MNCRYLHDGRCGMNLHGGAPSPGVCRICDRYVGPHRGIGDIVHAVAKVTGAAAAARIYEGATGSPCGCAERRAALNAAVPFPDEAKKES